MCLESTRKAANIARAVSVAPALQLHIRHTPLLSAVQPATAHSRLSAFTEDKVNSKPSEGRTEKSSTSLVPPLLPSWDITDAVIRLREHGTERVYSLPDPPACCTLGKEGTLRVFDATRSLSRKHAEAMPMEGPDASPLWKVKDLESTNGMRRDRERLPSFLLQPGIELALGNLRLICESKRLIALLEVLRRFMGWAPARQHEVDDTIRTLRDWATKRLQILLVADGDLMPIVRRLHDLVIGPAVPLAQYAKRDPAGSMKAAGAGTLCAMITSTDAPKLMRSLRAVKDSERPRLIFCMQKEATAAELKHYLALPALISLPSLKSRRGESAFIVEKFAEDIADEIGAPGTGFTTADLATLKTLQWKSLAAAEDAARRLVVLRFKGRVTEGAAYLGMDHGALGRWARSKGFST